MATRQLTSEELEALSRLEQASKNPDYTGGAVEFFSCSECPKVELAPVKEWEAIPSSIQEYLKGQARYLHLPNCLHSESAFQPDRSGKYGMEGVILFAMQHLGRETHIAKVCQWAEIPFSTETEAKAVETAANNLIQTGWIEPGSTKGKGFFRLTSRRCK